MNMRKIIAVLASALLLCAAIPMGALSVAAAPGDVALDANFDNGTDGFQCDGGIPTSNEGGYLTFNATCADWANAYAYVNGIKADTLYKVTFSAKADKDCVLQFKINNGWSGTLLQQDVDITTEWTDYEFEINTAGLTEGAIVTLQSGYVAADGAIYNIDNLKIVEIMDPALIGKIVNGDFETGEANGWNLPQQGGVSADAAHDGSYGINIKGNGGWGGMLDQTIPVNAGKAYEITFWLQINANGVNVQIKDGDTSGANIAGGWVDMNKAGSWTQFTYIVRPTTDLLTFNFCGAGNGSAEDAYLDSFTCTELKDPSFDGYIYNGDFETGKTDSWDPVWWAGNISVVEGRNGGYAMQLNHGMYQLTRQLVTVEPNTDYVVQCYAKNVNNMTLLAKSYPADANIAQAGMSGSDNWTQNSLVFNSGDCTQVYICVMGNVEGSTAIVDDFFMFEKVEESNDGYIINGTFETGALTPWDNLWGSCPKAEVIKGGMDSNFALEIISGQWKHVRQTNIAVEANTDYKITAWAKNAAGMSLLVKDGGDSTDIVNAGIEAGDEWTEFTAEFNTGDYTSIIFSLMGNNAEAAFGTFDNIVMEKVVCEHEYDDCSDLDCNLCGETREFGHNLQYNPAKDAIDCANPGNIENWFCTNCNEYFANAEATEMINPWYIQITVDCVKPEGLADCAGWTCETCGNENSGSAEHDVLFCQGGICSKCNGEIEGYGCSNSTTPACQDGVCDYCGGFVAGFGHENGAWAPCLDGECAYGCGLTYPATEDHIDEDGDFACDVCWNAMPHDCIDEDGNNECDICWSTMPHDCVDADGDHHCDICWAVMPHDCIDEDGDQWCDICWEMMPEQPEEPEIVYGDADGDGLVTSLDAIILQQFIAGYEVTLVEASADADGDGLVTSLDAIVLQQFIAGYDVVLGPQG